MNRPFLGIAIVCLCLVPTCASAQEAGKTGVTMGFPASVGVIWHASEKVAVRPEFSFAHSSTEAPGGETSSENYGLGVTVLFYTKKWDNAAAYIAPRFLWAHGHGESQADTGDFGSESTADSYQYSGSFGGQGWFGSRFSVFGEVGIAYQTGRADSSSSSVDLKNHSWSIRSGVGAILYF